MKKFKKSLSILLSLTLCLLAFVSCNDEPPLPSFDPSFDYEESFIHSYEKDGAPIALHSTEDYYFSFVGDFSYGSRTLFVGQSLDVMNAVYETENSEIWSLDASNATVAWCEITEERRVYSAYNAEKGRVALTLIVYVPIVFASNENGTSSTFSPR